MFSDFRHKVSYQINCYLVYSIVVVTIFWIIALNFVINNNSVIITNCFNFCIFDRRKRVCNNRKSCNTCCKVTFYISVVKCHLSFFVTIFVVHIMNYVQCVYVQARKPFHHIVVFVHYFVII